MFVRVKENFALERVKIYNDPLDSPKLILQ